MIVQPFRMFVFDIAGTTVRDENAVSKAFQDAFRPAGIELPVAEINPLMGYRKTEAIAMVLTSRGAYHDTQQVEDIHEFFVDQMIDHYMYAPGVEALPGAEQLFEELKTKGFFVGLNTGFPRNIADVIMNRFQWLERGLVDSVIASDEVESGRPAPFMIRVLMEEAGVDDPVQVVKVGDTEVDIMEGRNAGCGKVIAVTTGAYSRDQLIPFTPDHIIDSLDEIPGLIL